MPRHWRGEVKLEGTPSIHYRPDIDGLRAVAVLSVVAFHAAPSLAPGGYVGVDVFFVISGFLISTIILRERDRGSFSILGFYGRRIRRLFPALILMLAATVIVGWYLLLPHEFRNLGKHVSAGAAYFINFTLRDEAGYFDVAADQKPLLHLWSLAIEEQFYIVWPLLLLLFRRSERLFLVLALIMIVSLAANIFVVGSRPEKAFYLPQFRFWELALGSLLAMAFLYASDRQKQWLQDCIRSAGLSPTAFANLLSGIGLLLILVAAFAFSERLVYPGAWALVPTIGALLIIAAGPGSFVNRYVLSLSVLVAIGLISYPLYLWHWPLLSFSSILGVAENDAMLTAALVAIAFVLAGATYWFIERPVRRWRVPAVPLSLFGVTATACLLGALVYTGVLNPRLNEFRHHDVGEAVADWRYPEGLTKQKLPSGLQIFTSGDGPKTVLFFGDSNLQQYWPRIEYLQKALRLRETIVFATKGGCPPIPGIDDKKHPDCSEFADRALALAKGDDVTTVVIGAAWMTYFNNSAYRLAGAGGGQLLIGTEPWQRAFDVLAETMAALVAEGKTVWLVLNIPNGGALTPAHGFQRSALGEVTFRPVSLERATFENAYAPIKQRLIGTALASGAHIIDPIDSLCGKESCPGQTADGAFMYKDASHLRARYVRDNASFIDVVTQDATASINP